MTDPTVRRRKRRASRVELTPEELEATVGISMFDAATEPTAHARFTDPDTSHAAAQGLDALRPRQRDAWRCLHDGGPATHDELLVRYASGVHEGLYVKQSASGLRTRVCELGDLTPPLVVDTGDKRPSAMGNPATVWRAVER